MRYNRRNIRNNLIPQMDMMDFYNYLEFLNLGGLVKASTGTENIPSYLSPWNQKTTSYGDFTLDGEDFNIYNEGEFTTSKIERDRKKNLNLHDKRSDYLYDPNASGDYDYETKYNWMNPNLDPKDDPLRNKKWTLHNTSDEDMYYDKFNPTKLYTKDEWETKKNEDLVNRSIDMLNTRHLKNPELFQKVTGYDPVTGEITYEGEKLQGDLFAEKHHDADYLQFWNPDDPDNLTTDGSFTGALYEDVEQKDAAGNITHPGGNITGPTPSLLDDEDATSTYTFQDNPDNPLDVNWNPENAPTASIGFETDRPRFSPRSQIDTMVPIPTISKFPHGGAHDDYNYIPQTQQHFETQDDITGTWVGDTYGVTGPYPEDSPMYSGDMDGDGIPDGVDSDPYNPAGPTEVKEKKERQPWKNDALDVFGALVPAIGQVNQILENRDKGQNFGQLGHNQFAADTRDNRGITDINTGKSFEDKRVRYSQGAYGTELKKAQNGTSDLIPISETGPIYGWDPAYFDFSNPYANPYYVDESGSSLVHPDSIAQFFQEDFLGNQTGMYYNPYHEKLIDPYTEFILNPDYNTGAIDIQRPEGEYSDDEWYNLLGGFGEFTDNSFQDNLLNLGIPGLFNPVDTNYLPMNNQQLEMFNEMLESGEYVLNTPGSVGEEESTSFWPGVWDVVEPLVNPIGYFSDPIKSGEDEVNYRESMPYLPQDLHSTFMNLWGGVETSRLANYFPKKIMDKIPGMSKILGSSGPIARGLSGFSSVFSRALPIVEAANLWGHVLGNDMENYWPLKALAPYLQPGDDMTPMMRDTPFAMNTNMSSPYSDWKGLWNWLGWTNEETPDYSENPGGYASRYAMYKDMPHMPFQEFEPRYGYYPSGSQLAIDYGTPGHYSYQGPGNFYEDAALAPPRYDKFAARNPMGGDAWSADMITQYENWLIEQGHWPEDHPRWTDWEDMSGRNWEGVGKDDWDWWVENKKYDPYELMTDEEREIYNKWKPKNEYIDKDGKHQKTSDQNKVGRDFSKPGNPFYGDWSQELIDEVYQYDFDNIGPSSNYGWINAYPEGTSYYPGYQPYRSTHWNWPEYTDEDGYTYIGHPNMYYADDQELGPVIDYNNDGVIDEGDEDWHRLLPEYRPQKSYEYHSYDPSGRSDYWRKEISRNYFPYAHLVKRYGGNLPQAPDGNELNSDGEIDFNFLNYGECKGGGCRERGNVGFGASAFGGLEGDFTDMESTLAQLGLKGNLDLRSPMGFGANLSGEGGVQDYLSNVIEGNINPNPFYGGRLNLGYASPEQVFLSNDPYATPYPGFNIGAYGEYDSNRGPNFGVEGGWGPLSIMGGYNLDQQSPFFGAKLNINLEEGGEPSRTTQLRNRQYDDIDTTIELDEDIIQELMALGAEIEYV